MSTDDKQAAMRSLIQELREDYARSHNFVIIRQYLAIANEFEAGMLLGCLFWEALRLRDWDLAEQCVKEANLLTPDPGESSRPCPLCDAITHHNLGNDPHVIEWLIRHGADVERRDANDFTPLIVAIGYGLVEIVKLLIENGANVNTVEVDEALTPLMIAAEAGNESIVELLLDHGADIDPKNWWGSDAADVAEKKGHSSIGRLIQKRREQRRRRKQGPASG